eukprot:6185063-Alexandrium_andersonii.AAC.1
MSASLVGSEMCIRDRLCVRPFPPCPCAARGLDARWPAQLHLRVRPGPATRAAGSRTRSMWKEEERRQTKGEKYGAKGLHRQKS